MRADGKKSRAERSPRQGAAALELTFILIFVVIPMVYGAIDFARFAHTYNSVTNGARAGAGYGVMHPFTVTTQASWESQLRQAVLEEMSQYDSNNLQVVATRIVEGNGLWRVQVDVTYPLNTLFSWSTILLEREIPNQVDVARRVVIRGIR